MIGRNQKEQKSFQSEKIIYQNEEFNEEKTILPVLSSDMIGYTRSHSTVKQHAKRLHPLKEEVPCTSKHCPTHSNYSCHILTSSS